MKNTLPAMVAGLGVSVIAAMVAGGVPTASAQPWYGPCKPDYRLALHPDQRWGEVCANPAAVDGFGFVNWPNAQVPPPFPGQPLKWRVSYNTNRAPCFQVDPSFECSVPWEPKGNGAVPFGYPGGY